MTRGTPVEVISNSYDAFQRLRVSTPFTLLDSKLLYSNDTEIWDQKEVSGTGTSYTYNTNQASVTLAVSNATAGKRVRQTYQRCIYQPGKSQLILLTCNFHGHQQGVKKRIGYFDNNNGVYFESSDNTLYCCVRSYATGSIVEKRIPQSEWNACRMNSDDSEFDLNLNSANIFFISFEWLGVGNIFYGMVLNGEYVLLHQIKNANITERVYMSTPNLPIRCEIENIGSGPQSSFTMICCQVASEGGIDPSGIIRSFNRGSSALVIQNANIIYPILAFRLKSTRLDVNVYPIGFNVICTSSSYCLWKLIKNPTFSGTSLTYTSLDTYAFEFCNTTTTGTTITDNTGTLLLSGYAAIDSSGEVTIPEIPNKLILGSSIDGVSDVFALAIMKIGKNGTSDSFFASINIREIV